MAKLGSSVVHGDLTILGNYTGSLFKGAIRRYLSQDAATQDFYAKPQTKVSENTKYVIWNATSYRFDIQKDGIYEITGIFLSTGSSQTSGYSIFSIRKNGTIVYYSHRDDWNSGARSGAYISYYGSCLLKLAKGDYIQFWTNNSAGTSQAYSNADQYANLCVEWRGGY